MVDAQVVDIGIVGDSLAGENPNYLSMPCFNFNLKILKDNHFASGNLGPLAGFDFAVAKYHTSGDHILGLTARIYYVASLEQ